MLKAWVDFKKAFARYEQKFIHFSVLSFLRRENPEASAPSTNLYIFNDMLKFLYALILQHMGLILCCSEGTEAFRRGAGNPMREFDWAPKLIEIWKQDCEKIHDTACWI